MVDRASAEALHEKASQHYLSGEFAEALAAWEALLRLNPADERALEGTRLSRMMVPESGSGAAFEIEHDAIDSPLAQASGASRTAVLPDPIRQSEGIDFGDVAAVAPLPLGGAEDDAIDAALANLGAPEARGGGGSGSLADLLSMEIEAAEPLQISEVGESALAPFHSPAAPAGPPPAAGELSRRLTELLKQAEAAAEAGSFDEAKALLARIAVLDEDNAAAQRLSDQLREKENDSLRQIDDWIVEGVQLFEQGRYAEAKANFDKVLHAMPDHLEAQDYLRRIEEARIAATAPPASPGAAAPHAQPEEDFLASLTAPSAEPTLTAVPLAQPARSRRSAPAAMSIPAPVAGPAPAARKRAAPMMIAGALAVAVAAGWFFFRPSGGASDIPESAITGEGGAAAAAGQKSTQAPQPSSVAEVLAAPAPPPGDPQVRIEQAVAKGDWPAAIVAYNEILAAHPDDMVARAGLMEAAQRYRERKALDEQLEQARRAFADGEYEVALRLLYRMPSGVDAAAVEASKVAGWFNLGVVALKAGDTDQALTQFGEALALRPEDEDAKRMQAYAREYAGKPKDTAYRARVEGMEFRPLPK